MAPTTINGIEELQGIVGETIGPSDWRTVTQDMINSFADISGDHQWIHVDVERAKQESPFGGPIAHGNLTLSTIDGFRDGLMQQEGFKLGVNYGWNKVRFPAPVPVDSNIRASIEISSVDEIGDGWYQVVQRWTVEIEGGEKPVCVADSVTRVLA
jgi:acyl dehydratase